MSRIVCIETSTTNCSVALSVDGKSVAVREVNNGYGHAEHLTLFIESVVSSSGIGFNDLDAVAVSRGPGSYTGLRIGVSAAKGLCFALNIPLISVDTLFAMAEQVKASQESADVLYCPMIDARRMEVYCALFDKDLKVVVDTDAKIIDEKSFQDRLEKSRILFFGDGALKCREKIVHANAYFIPDIFPSAISMCRIAEEKYKNGELEKADTFEPFYLKDFIAGKGSVLPEKS